MGKEDNTSSATTVLPQLAPEQYEALKADIAANGILVPLIRDEHGHTIDGHARERIAADLQIRDIPVRVVAGLDDEEKRHMALSVNVQRRHLTPEQKRRLVADELRQSPDLSNNWLGQLLGVDGETVLAVRRQLEAAGTIPVLTEFRCKDGKRRKYASVLVKDTEQAARAEQHFHTLGGLAPKKPLDLHRLELLARRKQSRDKRIRILEPPSLGDDIQLYHADFRTLDVIKPASVTCVFTDPPYAPEYLPLWEALAERAAAWLIPGGVLVTYAGTFNLPDVLAVLQKHLAYQWTFSIVHGGNAKVFYDRNIQVAWRPLLLFAKGKYPGETCLRDCFQGPGEEKDLHPWQECLAEAEYFIERLTKPSDLVVDCFLGSGTTALACQKLGRRFVGCDIDQAWVVTAHERLRGVETGTGRCSNAPFGSSRQAVPE